MCRRGTAIPTVRQAALRAPLTKAGVRRAAVRSRPGASRQGVPAVLTQGEVRRRVRPEEARAAVAEGDDNDWSI